MRIPRCCRRLFHHGVHERGLPDARLTGDEHDLPFAAEGSIEPDSHLRELCLAAETPLLDVGIDRSSLTRDGRRTAGSSTRLRGRAFARRCGNLRDEAVAATMRRLDVTRCRGIVAQGLAELSDAVFQNGVAHERRGPHGFEQLLLGHQLAGPIHESASGRRRPSAAAGSTACPASKHSFVTSSRNCPNVTWFTDAMTETSPQHDPHVMTCARAPAILSVR